MNGMNSLDCIDCPFHRFYESAKFMFDLENLKTRNVITLGSSSQRLGGSNLEMAFSKVA